MRLQTAKRTFIAGLAMIAMGILASYLLDLVSYQDTRTWLFSVLENIFLPLLGLGLLTSIVGSVLLMMKANGRICYGLAASFLSTFAAAALFGALGLVRINVHDWSGMLIFPFMLILPLGIAFLISGALKTER